MWAMCGRVSSGPLASRAQLDRVERLADGALADGVDVRLEAERIEPATTASRSASGSIRLSAAVRGRAAGRVEIRLEHGRR